MSKPDLPLISPRKLSRGILTTIDKPYPAEKVDSSTLTVTLVRAVWDFDARDDSELSFKKGDEIIVTIQADGGWWMGKIGKKEGKIPINRVVVIQILEKKRRALTIDQTKVTSRIRALQKLVSKENLKIEAPKTPEPSSSPLSEKSPIGKRRRRNLSLKLSQNENNKSSSGEAILSKKSPKKKVEKSQSQLLEERRLKRRLERERRQRAIEAEQAERERILREMQEESDNTEDDTNAEESRSSEESDEISENSSDSTEDSTEESTESTEDSTESTEDSTTEEESNESSRSINKKSSTEYSCEVSTGSNLDDNTVSEKAPDHSTSVDYVDNKKPDLSELASDSIAEYITGGSSISSIE